MRKRFELIHFGLFLAYLIEITAFMRIIPITNCNLDVYGKMKKLIFVFILLSTPLSFANSAYAEHAEIVSYPSGCDYFIANGHHGYYLLKWHKGYTPSLGDVILGDIDANGLKDVYYPLKNREGEIYVEDYSMSKSRSLEHYKEHCN